MQCKVKSVQQFYGEYYTAIVTGQLVLLLASAIISEVRKVAQNHDSVIRGLELDHEQGLELRTADCQVLFFYHTIGPI